MPRGRPKKDAIPTATITNVPQEPIAGLISSEEKEENTNKKEVVKLEPLGEGQAYFEAPDGTIMIGDTTRDQILYRGMNNGKGGWINRRR